MTYIGTERPRTLTGRRRFAVLAAEVHLQQSIIADRNAAIALSRVAQGLGRRTVPLAVRPIPTALSPAQPVPAFGRLDNDRDKLSARARELLRARGYDKHTDWLRRAVSEALAAADRIRTPLPMRGYLGPGSWDSTIAGPPDRISQIALTHVPHEEGRCRLIGRGNPGLLGERSGHVPWIISRNDDVGYHQTGPWQARIFGLLYDVAREQVAVTCRAEHKAIHERGVIDAAVDQAAEMMSGLPLAKPYEDAWSEAAGAYRVLVPEVHVAHVRVRAPDEDAARAAVDDGDFDAAEPMTALLTLGTSAWRVLRCDEFTAADTTNESEQRAARQRLAIRGHDQPSRALLDRAVKAIAAAESESGWDLNHIRGLLPKDGRSVELTRPSWASSTCSIGGRAMSPAHVTPSSRSWRPCTPSASPSVRSSTPRRFPRTSTHSAHSQP